MSFFQSELAVKTAGKGTYDLTSQIQEALSQSGTADGLCVVFCRHTSCSLVLMENADPSARSDLENYLDRLVPDDDPHFTHTYEGPDDMPSHIKMALTRSSESIPFKNGRLQLGTWQGLFLCEHRVQPHQRSVLVTLTGQ
ncbi:MAG: secondary thiamine-phosphate synthase enzyme YjbQ [Opitutales bacterium]|jgi:secondary thiamine-phosphate synthase enzyme|nr:secondary thiamine-phosphate synthase enzyme YjbQ [Opitutales bacterium]